MPGLAHLQNIHPLVVHFPLALLPAAVLFYLLSRFFRNGMLANIAFCSLLLGALSAAAATGTGLYAEPGVMVSFSVRNTLLKSHETLMLITLGLSIGLALWASVARPFPERGRWLFLLLLLVMTVLMVKGADYGGRMVYDYNAGGNACGQPIEFTK